MSEEPKDSQPKVPKFDLPKTPNYLSLSKTNEGGNTQVQTPLKFQWDLNSLPLQAIQNPI